MEEDEDIQIVHQEEENPNVPEGGWGWVVCAAAFLVTFVVFGIHNSFGVIYSDLVSTLKLGEVESAWIGSMAGSLNFLGGPAASYLCNRYGCRAVAFTGAILAILGLFLTSFVQETSKMYVTFGLLWGLGSSFSFIPSIVVLGQYFKKRFPLANGIASSGAGIGSLLAAPFINYLLSTVGWQNSMRTLASFAVLLLVSAFLYRPITLVRQTQERDTERGLQESVWRCKPYLVLVFAVAMFQLCYPVPYVHLVQFAKDLGISSSRGSWLLGILAITSTASKIIFGKLSQVRCFNRLYLFQLAIFIMGLATALCPLATSYLGVLCYVLVYGLFDGCFVGQLPVVISDIVGHERLSQAIGNMFGVIAVPMSFGAPIAGWLHEAFGSYKGAFFMAGGTAILTSLSLFVIPCLKRTQRTPELTLTKNLKNTRKAKRVVKVTLGGYSGQLKSGAVSYFADVTREAENEEMVYDLSELESICITEKETAL